MGDKFIWTRNPRVVELHIRNAMEDLDTSKKFENTREELWEEYEHLYDKDPELAIAFYDDNYEAFNAYQNGDGRFE